MKHSKNKKMLVICAEYVCFKVFNYMNMPFFFPPGSLSHTQPKMENACSDIQNTILSSLFSIQPQNPFTVCHSNPLLDADLLICEWAFFAALINMASE